MNKNWGDERKFTQGIFLLLLLLLLLAKFSFHFLLKRKHFGRTYWQPRFWSVQLQNIQFPWCDETQGCKTRRLNKNISHWGWMSESLYALKSTIAKAFHRPLSEPTFWLIIAGKVSLTTLTMTSFHSSVPVSRDSVTVSQHAQYKDSETEAAKWNSAICQTCTCYFQPICLSTVYLQQCFF